MDREAGAPADARPEASLGRADAAVLFVAAALGAAFRLVPLASPDLLWQARAGDLVLATGRRLTTDAFTLALRGRPIRDYEPLWEAIVALADRTPIGLASLWGANVVLAALAFVAAAHLASTQLAAAWARACGAALVALAVSRHLELRGELAPVVAIVVAHGLRRGGATRWRRLAPIGLALIAAPFHRLAWLVSVVPLAWAIDSLVRGARARGSGRRRAHRIAAGDVAVALLSVATFALVMPGALRDSLPTTSITFAPHLVDGFTPWAAYRHRDDAIPLITMAVTTFALAGAALAAREHRANFADAALLLLLALPGLRWVRFVAMPLLATLPWSIAFVATVFERGLGRSRAWLRGSVATATTLAVLAIAAIGVAQWGVGARVGGYDFRNQPVHAVEWARTHAPHARLFHTYNQGAYLIYRRWPEVGVVIDARAADVYPDEYAARYYEVLADPSRFAAFARDERLDLAMLLGTNQSSEPLAKSLAQRGWQLVYGDEMARIFAPGPELPRHARPLKR